MMAGFHLDFISFAIGFITALLFWWAVGQLRILFPRVRTTLTKALQARRNRELSEVEDRLRKELVRRMESLHLAASLFSLDEILIPPTLLAPPPAVVPGDSDNPDEEDLLVIPYLPDWPEMICQLTVPRITLAEALQTQVNIAIIGQPGSGKTVALAHLTAQVARGDASLGSLASLTPLYLHAGSLNLENNTGQDPFALIVERARGYVPGIFSPQVPTLLRAAAQNGNLLLILDGGDELTQAQFQKFSTWVKDLLTQYPQIRLVITAAPEYLDGLPRLGFVPLAVAGWDSAQQVQFIARWASLWKEHIEPLQEKPSAGNPDPVLLNTWLAAGTTLQSPFELTLKVWAAYAGDVYGPRNTDSLDSYLRRVIPDLKLLAPLEHLAVQMILEGQTSLPKSKVTAPNPALDNNAVFENGLLVQYQHDSVAFAHPGLMGYLASQVIVETDKLKEITSQPVWTGRNILLHYLASHQDMTSIVEESLKLDMDDLMMPNLFRLARWLKDAPANAVWRIGIMRQLLAVFQRESAPFSLRCRALAALVCSNDPSVTLLLRDQLIQSSATVRHLAVLGAGAVQDARAYKDLVALLGDPDRAVRKAVCYTLLAFNTRQTIEVVSGILKQGDEELSQLVAEGLATRPDIGHRLLQEGSTTENLLARRAVIFGLRRVPDQWATDILQKMCIEDGQWIVRNAAAQALEDRKKPSPYLPKPLLPPHDSPWLVTFASKQGRGVSPSQPVNDLLLLALKSGNVEEKIACQEYLRRLEPDPGIMGSLYNILFANDSRLGDDIFYTLWLYAASGFVLAPTREFGLG